MKKSIAILIVIAFVSSSIVGCSTPSKTDTSSTPVETTTEVTTTTTEETTEQIAYKTYYLSNIKYEAPESWKLSETSVAYILDQLFYPEDSNYDFYMTAGYMEMDYMKNITSTQFEEVFGLVFNSFFQHDDESSITINSMETGKKGDFYFGRADFKSIEGDDCTHILFYMVFDNKTGTNYYFQLNAPNSISEEYIETFNTITDSIELR